MPRRRLRFRNSSEDETYGSESSRAEFSSGCLLNTDLVIPDVLLHADFEPVHTVRLGFFQRRATLPSIMPHAVAGDHSPGSVFSFLAVHEHWLVRIQDGQNFRDILLLGRH